MCHDQQPPSLGAPKFQACRVCETTSNSKGKPRFRRVPARWAAALLFGARNIRPVNSAAATTYESLTGARSSVNMAGRAVRKRPAAEIWPPEPKCVS